MANIREKIAKLLALAESPNENEAKAALLKARKLMAEYKLRPEECTKQNSQKVIKDLAGVSCTQISGKWAIMLSAIIAEHYCCKSYVSRTYNSKTYQIGFIGLVDDFNVCKQIYRYAYDCVLASLNKMKPVQGDAPGTNRKRRNAYGIGFCEGLEDAYKEQLQDNQEMGLVLVIPQAVSEFAKTMGKAKTFSAEMDLGNLSYLQRGYADGKTFSPESKLGEPTRMLGGA